MLAFRHRSHQNPDDASLPVHPWQESHAAPEDRAVGLELQLIELVHRRNDVRAERRARNPQLESEIAAVLDELAELDVELPAAV